MSDAGTTPPPLPESGAAKKGLSPLAWIAIGIGTFVAVGFAGCLALARISDLAVVPYRQNQSPRLDFRGSDARTPATEGDTLWVNYNTRRFSSRSTAS